jgi:dCTP deaminase
MSLVLLMSETSLLSDHDIKELIKEDQLQIDPLEPASIGQTSIDLHLGSTLVRYPPQLIKLGIDHPKSQELDLNSSNYILHSGEFILGMTKEKVSIPDGYQGVIETKGDIARAGIQIHNNDGHIDPGFSGHITLEIVNLNNDVCFELRPGLPICQLFIGKISSSCDSLYKGKYLDQDKPTPYVPALVTSQIDAIP